MQFRTNYQVVYRPKGKDHLVAGNRLSRVALPSPLNSTCEHLLEPGRQPQKATDIEAVERDAIQREAELAVPQQIPNSVMVAGLIQTARWLR